MYKLLLTLLLLIAIPETFRPDNDFFNVNAGRPVLDAHNCYPYDGQWANRIDRALSTGFPVGIEQDIASYTNPSTGEVIAKVTHNNQAGPSDPPLKVHFFERVKPIIERTLRENKKVDWPVIVLHFDFKDNSAPTLEAVWKVLGEYQDWISTAPKTANDGDLPHLDWKPLLVLTEDNDRQEEIFYRKLAVGDKLRLFGSAHTDEKVFQGLSAKQKAYAAAHTAPDLLLTTKAGNYRRWWNNSWWEVEEGGQQASGDWTDEDQQRLRALVDRAHRQGYWIRFYTLDGFALRQNQGWGDSYNFGSQSAVEKRWKAALGVGVDMIATDQYEALREFMNNPK